MKLKNLTAALLLVMTFGFAGCSREKQLLDTVPADAASVMVLDAEKFTGYMNGSAYGGSLSADEVLDRFLLRATDRSRNELKTLLTSDAIDRNMMVGFSTKGTRTSVFASMNGNFFYTFMIKDVEKFITGLDVGSPTEIGDFAAYQLEGAVLLVKERQGWITWGDPAAAAGTLDTQLDVASNTAITSVKGVAEYLGDDDGFLRTAISMAQTGEQGCVCVTADIGDAGKELEVNACYLDSSGKKAKMDKYLEDIDTGMLSYTTPSDMIVMAIGIKHDTDWEGLINYCQAIYPLDSQQRAALALALPYLKRIDGTLLVAAGATVDQRLSRPDFSNDVNFVVAVQVDKNQAKATLKDFAGVASLLGVPMIEKDGGYILQARGMAPVTLKIVNGSTIVLANRGLEQLGNDAALKVMSDNAFGLWANIPDAAGESIYGGRGFRLTMELDDDFETDFSFNGSDAPILEQLSAIVAADTDERPAETAADDYSSTPGFTPIDTIR